jgi:hypothetical protein
MWHPFEKLIAASRDFTTMTKLLLKACCEVWQSCATKEPKERGKDF